MLGANLGGSLEPSQIMCSTGGREVSASGLAEDTLRKLRGFIFCKIQFSTTANSRDVDSVRSLEVSSKFIIQEDRLWLIKNPVYLSVRLPGAVLSLTDKEIIIPDLCILV